MVDALLVLSISISMRENPGIAWHKHARNVSFVCLCSGVSHFEVYYVFILLVMSEKMHIREFKFNLSRDHSTNFRITRSISLLGDALNSCADRSTKREILAITDLILILVLIFYLWLSEVLTKGRRCYIRNATSSLVGRDLAQLCFVNGHWSCLYLAGVSLLCILSLFQKDHFNKGPVRLPWIL